MSKLRTVKAGASTAWDAATLRAWFGDPELFGARRLLSDSSGSVDSTLSGATLSIRVDSGGKTHFSSVRIPRLDERSRAVTGNCTCGAANVCQHMVAGFMLHAAKLRGVPVDQMLMEVLGSGATATTAEQSQSRSPDFAKALVQWLKIAPDLGSPKEGPTVEAMLFLEASHQGSNVLDRVGVETRSGTQSDWQSLSSAAVNDTLPRAVQRGAALLLAEGAGRQGERWGAGAAAACIDLARQGRLRLFGSSECLKPGPPERAEVRWRIDGESAVLDVQLPPGTTHLVDAEPGLYVTESGEIGLLEGIPVRVLAWAQAAPPVPAEAEHSFRAKLAARGELAAYLPTLVGFATERASATRATPAVALKGQGSTARIELAFDYGGIQITEPGPAGEVRKFVGGRWVVATRDTALEDSCVERLKKAGLRQGDFRRWTFNIPALFAQTTAQQWLALQRGLIRDLEFEDWIVTIDEDFGFRPDVQARLGSAEAEQRVNRKKRAA